MHVIGEETSQRLDVIPAQFRVIVTHRPKYACRACEEAVVQAPAPERLIKGGLPTEAMVAYVLVAKYAWHLPLYRQAQMLVAQGLDIKRAVLAFWVGYAAAELKPLYLAAARAHSGLGQDRGRRDGGAGARSRPRPHQEGLLLGHRPRRPAVGRDRPAGDRLQLRSGPRRGPRRSSCSSAIAASCSATAMLPTRPLPTQHRGEAITLAFCWAHLRRGFFDIAKGGNAPIASEALERIAALYAIEKTIRGNSAERAPCRAPGREQAARGSLKTWLEQQLARVSGKSPIAEAIRYGLNHWDGLTRFLDDGRIELDTNIVERGIRPIVLNRKNALFAGHDQGAENWACIASLIETCKLQRRRSASLPRRRAHQARQSLARLASRRAHALGLGGRALGQQTRGVTPAPAKKSSRQRWDQKTAYSRRSEE